MSANEIKQDEIIRMAREACAPNQTFNSDEEWVKRFAALGAENTNIEPQRAIVRLKAIIEEQANGVQNLVLAEREACAKSVYDSTDWAHEERDMVLKEAIAAAIRARGEK